MEKVLIFKNNLNYSLEGTVITKALNFESEQVKDLYIDFHLQGYTDSSLGAAKWKIDLDNRPTRSLVYANAYMTSFVIDIINYKEEILNSNFAVSKTEKGHYKFWWIVGIDRLGQQKTTLYQISLLLDPYWTYGIHNIFSPTKELLIKHAHIREYIPLIGNNKARKLLDIWSNPYINADEGLKFNDSNYLLVDKENLLMPFMKEHPTWTGRQIIDKIFQGVSHGSYPYATAAASSRDIYTNYLYNVIDVYYYWRNSFSKSNTKNEVTLGSGTLYLHGRKDLFLENYKIARISSLVFIDTKKQGTKKEEDFPFLAQGDIDNVTAVYPDNHQHTKTLKQSWMFWNGFDDNPPVDPGVPQYSDGILKWGRVDDPNWENYVYKPSRLKVEELMADAQKIELSATRVFINPLCTPDFLNYAISAGSTTHLNGVPKYSVFLFLNEHGTKKDAVGYARYIYPLHLFGNFNHNYLEKTEKVLDKGTNYIVNEFTVNSPYGSGSQPSKREENFYIENLVQSEKFFKDPLVDNTIFKFNHKQIDPIKMDLHPYTKYTLYTPAHNKMEIMRQFLNITNQNYLYFKKLAVLNPNNNFNYIIPYNVNQDGTGHLYGYDNRYNLFLNDMNTYFYPEDSNAFNQFMIANKSQLNQNYTNNLLGGSLRAVGGVVKGFLGGAAGFGKANKTSSPFLSGTGISDLLGASLDIYKAGANYAAQVQDLKRTPGQWESKGQDLLGNNYIKNQFPCIFKFQLMDPFKKIVKKLFIAHGYALGGYYPLYDFLFGNHQRYFFNYIQALGAENLIKIPLSLDLKDAIGQAFVAGFEVRHIRRKMLQTNGNWKSSFVTNTFNNYELNNLDFESMDLNND